MRLRLIYRYDVEECDLHMNVSAKITCIVVFSKGPHISNISVVALPLTEFKKQWRQLKGLDHFHSEECPAALIVHRNKFRAS